MYEKCKTDGNANHNCADNKYQLKHFLSRIKVNRQNFWNPELSIEELAKKIGVSPAFFRREFNRVYGTSPKSYLDALRIQYAKTLLETDYFSQKEISYRCGFSDVGYFRTVFKRKIGKSIKAYLSDKTRYNY